MGSLTASERLLETCLSDRRVDFDRIPEASFPTPDYKLNVEPEPVFAEVKEFGRSGKRQTEGYCPVPFVREKIKASRKKFERHMDSPCCVVLYNHASFTVVLQPELVLCAMFGELYETVGQNVFRYFGVSEMRPDENTRIGGVVALLPLRVHRNCVEAGRRMYQLTGGFSRELTDAEVNQIHRETSRYLGEVESVFRAVVVENPWAKKRLPRTLFTGPFDERWAMEDDGTVRLAFSGKRVAEMRSLLPKYALKMMGLW
jgi:hypothetical protein